jgi:hypothetical protein
MKLKNNSKQAGNEKATKKLSLDKIKRLSMRKPSLFQILKFIRAKVETKKADQVTSIWNKTRVHHFSHTWYNLAIPTETLGTASNR